MDRLGPLRGENVLFYQMSNRLCQSPRPFRALYSGQDNEYRGSLDAAAASRYD